MKIKLNKAEFLEKLSFATSFTSAKLISLPILQNIYIKIEKNLMHFYSSNLNSFFHTTQKIENNETKSFVIEPKKLVEFLGLLPEGKIDLQVDEKQISVTFGKTSGKFPLVISEDFPLPPKIDEKEQKLKTGLLTKNLPLVLFSASSDETRPVLSGVNFLTNEELIIVATDGFRLSLLKTKKEENFPSAIIPAEFLREMGQFIMNEEHLGFFYSAKEKIILFKIGEIELYSRLIEGDFPPFEKVIPQEKKTSIKLDREEFLRNIKLISIFARDFSNIIVLETQKGGVSFKPKTEEGRENSAFQECQIEGEQQKVAFNYKFLLDFLNTVRGEYVIVEILRADAPIVFKTENESNFLHIIMPVRIQE